MIDGGDHCDQKNPAVWTPLPLKDLVSNNQRRGGGRSPKGEGKGVK